MKANFICQNLTHMLNTQKIKISKCQLELNNYYMIIETEQGP